MRVLTIKECHGVSGALTDKQTDSLLSKIGAYSANIVFLSVMYGAGYISLPAFLIGGVGSAVVKIAGTYIAYENKENILKFFSNENNLPSNQTL